MYKTFFYFHFKMNTCMKRILKIKFNDKAGFISIICKSRKLSNLCSRKLTDRTCKRTELKLKFPI